MLAPAAGAPSDAAPGTAPAAPGVAAGAGATAQPSADASATTTAKGEMTTVELSRTQQTIARRMAESKATIPDFTLLIDVDMEECVGCARS